MDELILALFRWASAGATTGAAAYVGWHYFKSRDLFPRIVWNYAGIVLTIVSAWRWFVILFSSDWGVGVHGAIQPWIAPMTQAGYILLSMVLIVLTYTHIKARERHWREWHGDES